MVFFGSHGSNQCMVVPFNRLHPWPSYEFTPVTPGESRSSEVQPSCVFGFHHFVTTDLSHVARWSQHHGPFSCRCTSPKKKRTANALKALENWCFFFKWRYNYLLFGGKSLPIFRRQASSLVSGRVSVRNNLSKRWIDVPPNWKKNSPLRDEPKQSWLWVTVHGCFRK